MSRRKTGWLIAGSIVALSAAVLGVLGAMSHVGHGESPAPKRAAAARAERTVSVTVAPVTFRPVQRSVEVVGTFCGQEEVLVTPEVDARVIKVYHDLGDVVHVGDVLTDFFAFERVLDVAHGRFFSRAQF